MDSSSFDEIFRRFQSVTGTSTQQELADVLGIKQSTILRRTLLRRPCPVRSISS